MPRKTKEQKELNNVKETTKKEVSITEKEISNKSLTSKNKSTTNQKSTAKKTDSKVKNVKANSKKSTINKSAESKTKKTNTTKSKAKKATNKSTSTKKSKATKSSKPTRTKKEKLEIVEYYDLPYRYNQTIVKVLAQTPTTLFIYWDISDKDKKIYEKRYGEYFFENTRPVLIVHNDTLGYSFEVEINDFANSWYLNVADSKCDYRIELGRRPIVKNEKIHNDYFYVSESNEIESPNDRILFNKEQKMVYFRNVKTGENSSKSISSISFIRNMGKIYDIYNVHDLYKAMYQGEDIEKIYDLSNPSSGNPSSGNPSSRF